MRRKRPQPFYRPARKLYYVQIGAKQYNLGPDEDKAWEEYHRLMAKAEPQAASRLTVVEVLTRFLDWSEKNNARTTYIWYKGFLRTFPRAIPSGLLVADLKVHHVTAWLLANSKKWHQNSQHDAARCIKRAMKWAEDEELIEKAPLKKLVPPPKTARETWYTEDEWQTLLNACRTSSVRDMLIFLRETGCRPFEHRNATALNFDRQNRCLIFKIQDSKGKRHHRKIILSNVAFDMVQKAALKYPDGPIFRNTKGKPWTASAVSSEMSRLRKRIGWRPMPYAIRHTFCRDALRNGVDALYVSELLGHRDRSMVAKVYGHIGTDTTDMRRRLEQALGKNTMQTSRPSPLAGHAHG